MLKIGDFSKVCQLSIRTLRHWDSIGLLVPANVDSESGYRYYSIEQLDHVNRILAFRAMGLSLTQITQLLSENLSAAEIRGMLRLKQAEIEQQIEQAAAALTMIEVRLSQMETEGTASRYETVLKSIPAQRIYGVRGIASDMLKLVNWLYEIEPYSRQHPNTNLLAVFHDEGFDEEAVDVEIGFPMGDLRADAIPLKDGRALIPTDLPGLDLIASTIHAGTWVTLPHGYGYLGRWIENNGYEIVGAGREIFHHIDWENQQKATVTELQFPVKKR